MNQAELQQEIQRVTTAFLDRIAQAGELPHAAAADASVSLAARAREAELLQRVLLYSSNALDIVTGPFPEVNALDLLVFAQLCHGALERHWVPHSLGERAKPFLAAFALAKDELWQILVRIFDAQKQADLQELIASWEREHPDQYRVEGVRFQEFAEYAGNLASERSAKSRGLLGQVRTATQAADQALLISERAFFFIPRVPSLLRMQARLAAKEVLADSLTRIEHMMRRFTGYALLIGFGWSLCFWAGSWLVNGLRR